MSDHLLYATPELRGRLEQLGGARLIAALDQLVEDEEEWVCEWFDAQDEDHAADEVSGWFLISAVEREDGTLDVTLEIEVVIYPMDNESDEGIWNTGLPANATVRPGPPLVAEDLDLDTADAALRARVAARRPTVYLQVTERGVEIHGLPGPDDLASDAATIPAEDGIPHPVSDAADYLDAEPPTYAEEPSDQARPPDDDRGR